MGTCGHTWYRREELANTLTHALGFVVGIGAFVALMIQSDVHGSERNVVGCAVFGTSLLFTYLSSAIYHYVENLNIKHRLRYLDHISIYFLIAGTYTPFTLVTLDGPWGWTLFGVIWSFAAFGICFKIYTITELEWLSTLVYVLMGWTVLVAIVPIVENLPLHALFWLVGGGIFYTVGVLFFLLETLPFSHTIWHLFVMAGSICHFFAIYWYVAPVMVF